MRRNKLKRATTKPKPIRAKPVLIQAKKVRSFAQKIRGSTFLNGIFMDVFMVDILAHLYLKSTLPKNGPE